MWDYLMFWGFGFLVFVFVVVDVKNDCVFSFVTCYLCSVFCFVGDDSHTGISCDTSSAVKNRSIETHEDWE